MNRHSTDSVELGHPMFLLAMGSVAESVLQEVLSGAQQLCGGKVPFHLGLARLVRSDSGSAQDDGGTRVWLQVVRRAEQSRFVGAEPEAALSDAWPDRPSEDDQFDLGTPQGITQLAARVLDEAGRLSGTQRLEAATREGIAFLAGNADIILLVDQQEFPNWWAEDERTPEAGWWPWAAALGAEWNVQQPVTACVFSHWPQPSSGAPAFEPLERIRRRLIGAHPFSQCFLVGDLNQGGGRLEHEDQARIVAGYLVDRLWPQSAEKLQAALGPGWVESEDDPGLYLWSFTHKTVPFDPDDLISQLQRRDFLAAVGHGYLHDEDGRPRPPRDDSQAAPAAPAAGTSTAATAPRAQVDAVDCAGLKQLTRDVLARPPAPEHKRPAWRAQLIGGADRAVRDFGEALWSVVKDRLAADPTDFEHARVPLLRAQQDLMAVMQRLRIDAVAADRAMKDHYLRRPKIQKVWTIEVPHRLRGFLIFLGIVFLSGGLLAGGLGLRAYEVGMMAGGAVGTLIGILLLIWAWLLRNPVIPQRMQWDAPPPHDMTVIRHAERELIWLHWMVSRALSRIDEIAQRWEAITSAGLPEVTPHDPAPHGLSDAELQKVAAQAEPERRNRFQDMAARFAERMARAVRGEIEVEDAYGPLQEAFRPLYEFLYQWDIRKLISVTQGKDVTEVEQDWGRRLQVPWPLGDESCAEQPCYVTIVTQRRRQEDGRSRGAPSKVRVYKFCLGIQPARLPAPSAPPTVSGHE